MRTEIFKKILTIGSLTILFLTNSFAQNASVLWIDFFAKDTCYSSLLILKAFGNHIDGTYGEDYQLHEFMCPPVPPPEVDAFWENIPGRYDQTFSSGQRCGADYRGWSSSSQIDTFKLTFYDWCGPVSMFSFHWPDSLYLAERCDSMFIVDTYGRIPKTNMFTQDSLNIPVSRNNSFLIIKYGARLVDIITGVQHEGNNKPQKFSLHQNFPNPFNPTTTLSLDIDRISGVALKVYNIFGQSIATLVSKCLEPGSYSFEWDASAYPSGVYFYELRNEHRAEVKKMMLLK